MKVMILQSCCKIEGCGYGHELVRFSTISGLHDAGGLVGAQPHR